MTTPPFWEAKSLAEMTLDEWESLCDGCGRCCLVKLEEEDTGHIYYTGVGCRLLDGQSCRCNDYQNRLATVSDCVGLTPETVGEIGWLPPTCAYRLLHEGHSLPAWHPLITGDVGSIHAAGVSVRGRVQVNEVDIDVSDLENFIVDWPLRQPMRSAKPRRP